MGSFGNYVGSTMGGEYDDSWVTNDNYPERQALLQNGKLVQLADSPLPADRHPDKYVINSSLLGEVPGLTSDHSTYDQVEQNLTGPGGLNWESWKFTDLRSEMQALQPDKLDALAAKWKDHGNTLKTESEAFQKSVRNVISQKWSGAAADAADAATQQVTKTSIYDFTPSADALSNRLTVLSGAFRSIIHSFPHDADSQLIDSGNFNQQRLNQRIAQFNSEYHLDGSGRLRNNSDGYVSAAQAIDEMNQINRSIGDYQRAVQLFQDTYNPTVEAVTANFPNLPSPPDMTYGQQGSGSGTGTGFGAGGGGLGAAGAPAIPAMSNLAAAANQSPAAVQASALPSSSAGQVPANPAVAMGSPTSGMQAMQGMQGLSSLGNALQSPLGQAMSAAQRAGSAGGVPGAGGPGKLPPGALNLGPKGAKGGGGGVNAGAARNPAIGRAAGAPPGAASPAGRTTATGLRSGLSGAAGAAGAGAPAAGAPGGGYGGAGAAGTPRQPSKALRKKMIVEQAEAVVAVLGDTPSAKPDGA